MLKMSSPY